MGGVVAGIMVIGGAGAMAGAGVAAGAMAGAAAGAMAGAAAVGVFRAVVVVVAVAGAIVFAGAVGVAMAGSGSGDVGVACGVAVVFTLAMAGAVVRAVRLGAVFAVALTVAVGVAVGAIVVLAPGVPVTGAFAGFGLGAWYRLKNFKKDWVRFFAVLAFPWFCWFPIVGVFATLTLNRILIRLALLNFPAWQQTLLIEMFLCVICIFSWWQGKHLEEMSRNPLQGSVLESALKTRNGRHLINSNPYN
ncbi:MAG: hypothetical protein F6J89_01460 [Symploca sp. SIO1C4]|uniref:Uncharacterized protein n=1 Tax=Symploca sp. SIO1C4 TaxID=2607765 RepID=A0A6B3N4A8_9CYAN|nr:hypothetical protein [Symploca sp. SIO1C4]